MERKLSRLEISLEKIRVQNDKVIAMLGPLGMGGLAFATTVKN